MTDRLKELKEKPWRRVVGLNAGTSRDGVDAALVRVRGHGLDSRFVVDRFVCRPLPSGLRQALDAREFAPGALCRLHWEIGAVFVEAAKDVLDGDSPPDLIGSHGMTLWHAPPPGPGLRGASLQLGEEALLAETFDCPVISGFRAADIAAGGQGAPLMPYLDYLLFRDRPGTLLLNLGGIANITWVGESLEEVVAFDTGPGNMPLDLVARRLWPQGSGYDEGGRGAAMGHVDPVLLDQLTRHPFLLKAPPKTTGRKDFGPAFVERLLDAHRHMKLLDILATFTEWTAAAVESGVNEWVRPRFVKEILVSGGGLYNLTLMAALRRRLDPIPVRSLMEEGIDPDAKEALLFAVLANDRLFGIPTNIPAATGAKWPVRLGRITD